MFRNLLCLALMVCWSAASDKFAYKGEITAYECGVMEIGAECLASRECGSGCCNEDTKTCVAAAGAQCNAERDCTQTEVRAVSEPAYNSFSHTARRLATAA